jgi:hypothetical protein
MITSVSSSQTATSMEKAFKIVEELTGVTRERMGTRTKKRDVITARALLCSLLRTHMSITAAAKIVYPYADLRTAMYNLISMHNNLCTTNPIYQTLSKQAHQKYAEDITTYTSTES